MKLINNKKGQLFIAVAVVILVLLFTSYNLYSMNQQRESVRRRVQTMNSFVGSLEKDLQREVYVFGFRFLVASEQYMLKEQSYLGNVQIAVSDAFYNCSIHNNVTNASDVLEGATLRDIINTTNHNARRVGMRFNFTGARINVYQEDPYSVTFILTGNLSLRDYMGLARWDRQENVTAKINIVGFEDPLYILGGRGYISKRINASLAGQSAATKFGGGYYTPRSTAPNFLNRLAGNLSAQDATGIESFVNVSELSQKLPAGWDVATGKSVIDYIYFNPSTNPASCQISGMPVGFRLDEVHRTLYDDPLGSLSCAA